MSSSNGGIGSTLTAGIQDIAGILPLLGTEQCSVQVCSALTHGYLYAAASPMSIFGSLGVVRAGFKTLLACFSFGDIEGADILGNMGYEPEGENLSLIMIEAGKSSGKAGKAKKTRRYVIHTRIDDLIKDLNIDKNRIAWISHDSADWNVRMIAMTALLCAFSITPYIYLDLGANNLEKSTTWVFPALRATGGFITATLIQLLIQRRITTLSDEYIKEIQLPVPKRDQQRNTDVEAAKKYQTVARRITPTWLLLCLLLIGLIASVVGYVGCFSVVQNSTSINGPVSWLCLEAGLSVIRLAIWACNPTDDDAPPLKIILELDEYERNPLPTCNKDNEEILQSKVLPLTRARDFLKIITSFAGLIGPFSNPDLSLYYTLTRKRPSKESVPADTEPENAEKHKLGERILYITVFDHKERTTRVYTQNNEKDIFYSTKSVAPLVDVGHFLLEVEIDDKFDPENDPVCSDSNIRVSLRSHHQSILKHIQYRLGNGPGDRNKLYAIENSWTMKVEDTISTLWMFREEDGHIWKEAVQKGKDEERNEKSLSICDYFVHSSIEKERQLLDEKRAKWIARRMEVITKETEERFQGEMAVEHRVDRQTIELIAATPPEEIQQLLCGEQYLMELLLLYEVKEWEELFWKKFKAFLERPEIGNEDKKRLRREWRADCWKRLNPQMHAAVKRVADSNLVGRLGERWASSIRQLFEGVKKPNSISLSELRDEIGLVNDEIRLRMEEEVKDTEFRLKRGSDSDIGRFDQFWDDDNLFKCRYSRSKWLYLSQDSTSHSAPLEIYLRALHGNRNIIHFTFSNFDSASGFQAIIRDLPWVTSISFALQPTPPAIHRDHLFIKSTNNNLNTFADRIRLNLKLDPDSRYIFTDAEGPDMYSGKLENNAKVLISFVAPTFESRQRLILRLKHSGSEDGTLEVTLKSTTIQFNPSSKSSLTIDDITLYPIQVSKSNHLSFEPGIRNDIVVQFRGNKDGHFLHDVELVDEAALEDQRNSRPVHPKLRLTTDAVAPKQQYTDQQPDTDKKTSNIGGAHPFAQLHLFALIIGINEYESPNIPNLLGAVPDADAMRDYLQEHLGVPSSHIRNLRNGEAMRAAIIDEIYALSYNDEIKEGDPILIYYAGHGGSADAPMDWEVRSTRKIEILVPYDHYSPLEDGNHRHGTRSTGKSEILEDGNHKHGIPDRTLGALLSQLASKKGDNITVILDCCYSGSNMQNYKDPAELIRGIDAGNIPSGLDRDLLFDFMSSRGTQVESGFNTYFNHRGLSSHVLLAACGSDEFAFEQRGRGLFTQRLLDALTTFEIDKLTYAGLIQRMPPMPWQNPQCSGVNQNRIIFKSTVYYKIREEGEGYVLPDVGSARGISLGDEFKVYQDQNSGYLLGIVVASKLRPFSTTLYAKEPRFTLEGDGVALQTGAGTEDLVLRIHVADEGLKALVEKIDRTDPSHRIIQLVGQDQAEFGMALEDGKVVFHIFDSLATKYGITRMPFSLEPTLEAISPVLRAADHFYWHLQRTPEAESDISEVVEMEHDGITYDDNLEPVLFPTKAGWKRGKDFDLLQRTPEAESDISKFIEIEVMEMEHDGITYDDDFEPVLFPSKDGWKRGKNFDLQIKGGTVYRWRIINKSSVAIYPALFYFDNSDWSITSYYQPPTTRGIIDPPLKGHQYLPVGYEDSGTVPHTSFLREGQNVNVGILKLFLLRKQVDLSDVAQSSPFVPIGARSTAPAKVKGHTDLFHWDTILVPVVLRQADR